MLVLVVACQWAAAPAEAYLILHNFTGIDGGNPSASLILDADVNLYGTAGGVFKLKADGTGYTFYNLPVRLPP